MKVLVIGETCYDTFIYGKCDRLCPEAPVPVFLPEYEKTTKGMAANVYKNLEALEQVHGNKIVFDLWTNDSYNEKIRYVDEQSNQMILRVDKEASYNLQKELWSPKIEDYDAVIVSDYNKGLLSELDLQDIGKRAKLSFIDTKKKYNYSWAKHFDFIKINNKEAKENGFYDIKEIFDKMIITAASDGCYFKAEHFPIKNKSEVRDVCGAGDTFLAAFSYSMLVNNDPRKAIDFAQDSCQYVISKKGVVTI
jgi:D-beta-D-heptose 7-phosphate kinase/D-beta-D-heptose 1-phosphate adenosyltransferase